jgi:hypothetical protein
VIRNDNEVALLKATATKGSQSPSDLAEVVGSNRTYTLMSHALTVGASRKFTGVDVAGQVTEYVSDLKNRYPAVDILKPSVAEALLRAALGEPERLEGINPNDAGALLFFLAHVLLVDQQLDDAQVESFVDQVLRLASSV